LKNKYLNLKKKLQQKIGDEKAGVRGTDGGPYQKLENGNTEKKNGV